MPQKISIIKIEKPDEYILKEMHGVEAIKYKLLKDSDWTQLPDSELSIITVLRYRFWRHQIRATNINRVNYDEMKTILEEYSDNPPIIDTKTKSIFITTQFDFTTVNSMITSSTEILNEFHKYKKPLTVKKFYSTIRKCKTIQQVFDKLIEEILNGYRH